MKKISIGLIDDHKIVRQGLKELLERLGNYEITQEFESGLQFIGSLPLKQKADIYILDYSMPKLNGIEVLQKLEELKNDDYKILLLTQHFEEQIINDAYHYGARGFLHKNCTASELNFALENIVKFGYNNISEILKRIRNYEPIGQKSSLEIPITDREFHFLELVCDEKELTYEQIGDIMGVSVKSVDVYRASLFEKFNIKSKVGLVLFSYKNKLTPPFI